MEKEKQIDGKYEYFAFISYKEEDAEWAKWLQRKLEHYKLPTALRKNNPNLPERVNPIYEYKSEASSGRVRKEIWKGLISSKYLIVVCSPRATKSEWLNDGIRYFVDSGLEENIIPFIIDGKPKAEKSDEECFPSALLELTGDRELRGININEMGRDAAAVKVVARMFDLKFDALWQRYEREKRLQRNRKFCIIAGIILLFVIGASVFAFREKENAERISKQYNELEKANKEIATQRDSANFERKKAIEANSFLEVAYKNLKIKNDSIELQNNLIAKQKNDLDKSNQSLKLLNIRLKEERDNVLLANTRAVAEKALDITKEGDSYTARLLLSELLYNHYTQNAPFCPEAENALRYADKLQCHIMNGHSNKVTSAVISPDNKYIASSSWDGFVNIWDVNNGKLLRRLNAQKDKVFDVAFSPSGKSLACSYYDGIVRIWNHIDGYIEKELNGHTLWAQSVTYSNNGKLLITTYSFDKTAIIWDISTGKIIHQLKSHNNTVRKGSFSPDDKIVATAAADSIIRLWDVKTGKEIKKMTGHIGYINDVSFSPDGQKLLSAGEDRTIRVWDCDSGKEILKILGHDRMINSASFSSDGTKIVSASNDNSVKIFDAMNGSELKRFVGHTDFVQTAGFILNDKNVLSSSYDGTVRVWDIKDFSRNKVLSNGAYDFHYVSFSPDDNYIVSAGEDNIVRLWDIKQDKEIRSMAGHSKRVYCASFSPNGEKIVSASFDNSIIVWDTKTGKLLCKLEGHTKPVSKAFYSPQGTYIASSSWDGTIIIWDANSYKVVRLISAHEKPIISISYSPNGKYLVSSSTDKTACIWDIDNGNSVLQLKEHEGTVSSVSYSPNGKNILTVSDKSIRIWNTKTGKAINMIKFPNEVSSASYSHDGRYIVATLYNGIVLVLDARSGIVIEKLNWETKGYSHRAYMSSFNSSGEMIVTACADNSIRVWEFKPLKVILEECRKKFIGYTLTPEERKRYYLK